VESLLDAGHQVTVVSPYATKNPVANRNEITIDEIEDTFGSKFCVKYLNIVFT
jgi:hypothetical protein